MPPPRARLSSLFPHKAVCSMRRRTAIATNLALDDRLIEEAVRVGGHKTKKEAVTAALAEYVRARRRGRILQWVGRVEYFDDYDYKATRL